ncbi:1-phosphatidylinositol 4-kinase [Aureococcus anophagefferens]|uniref:1-phosphatidylinositol 4-kinase n=1 Tax=Aureococcus anophagefferens TaxID=44056 RepID=A0ABR1G4M2_AURAN
MGCGPSQLKRHENDLKMVEQLLAKDGATLDAGTTALLIWKCRRDPRLVAAAAAWLEKHSDARRAFDGVEFYLPQLSHMLVHLDVDWPAGTLERFALVVAQQSPHFALQLHWILRAALEDYAPRGDGSGGHERYYRRCAHLAADVESCVAHGSAPENLEELFVAGLIGRDELGARARRSRRPWPSASTDTWRSVLRIVPDEGSVFNTKERCPCLVYFETAQEPGLEGLDVANVVHAHVAGPDAALPGRGRGASAPEKQVPKTPTERRRAGSFDSEQSPLTPRGASAEPPRFGIRRGSRGRSSPPGDGSPAKPGRRSSTARGAALSIWRPERRGSASPAEATPSPMHAAEKAVELAPSGNDEPPPRPDLPLRRATGAGAPRVRARVARPGAREPRPRLLGRAVSQEPAPLLAAAEPPQEHDRPSDASAGRWSFGEGPSMWARPSEARHPELSHGAGWKAKEQAARDKSPFAASAPSWRLQAVIVKSNDDLRQEVFVVQLIAHYARAFRSAKLGLFLRPYRIVAVSSATGLIELVKESTSLDRLYASSGGGLKAHFESTFGPPGSPELSAAVARFAESLRAASFVCYVLAIKDRHNGNILLDAQGRIVHIDFGFVLGHATGGAFSMERAPFKLTGDFLDSATTGWSASRRRWATPSDGDRSECLELPTKHENRRTFVFRESAMLTIETCSFYEGKLGHAIWPAAVAAAIWARRPPELFDGKTVLELGSGVGTFGIAVAALTPAKRVVLSDLDAVETSAT